MNEYIWNDFINLNDAFVNVLSSVYNKIGIIIDIIYTLFVSNNTNTTLFSNIRKYQFYFNNHSKILILFIKLLTSTLWILMTD